jgi:hypothetical protein
MRGWKLNEIVPDDLPGAGKEEKGTTKKDKTRDRDEL